MKTVKIRVSEKDYKDLRKFAEKECEGSIEGAAKDCFTYGFFELIEEPLEPGEEDDPEEP